MQKKENLSYTCKRIKKTIYSKQIIDLKNRTLLSPNDYKLLSEQDKEKYQNTGFVIGDQPLKTMNEWISTKENIIITALQNTDEEPGVIGYIILLQTKDFQNKVREYLKDMINFDYELLKNLDEDFCYLIQLAVDYEYINNGIGTTMFYELKKHLTRTTVSYVMKNPLLNKISLYFHLKVGFRHFGDYVGEYDNFRKYQSVGLMLPKLEIQKKQKSTEEQLLGLMESASKLSE